ncbi:MAG: glycosyl hydrolase family 28-related protein [Planctomycetota bacterium]|jgi:hypothetical protein
MLKSWVLVAFVISWELCFAVTSAAIAAESLELPRLDWEPRSDWLNVRQAGAKGDGKADDTEALQKVFDQIEPGITVYLPAGIYRVRETLLARGPAVGVSVIGHGRDTTLLWDGPVGGVLLQDDGVSSSKSVGLNFEGQGKAAVGFHHRSTCRFETEVLHQHLAFRNFTDAGLLAASDDAYALAETTFDNCLFDHCQRGAVFISFNDYNWTFDGCEFQACDVSLECRHGNFYVRNTHFQDSRTVDVLAQPEHGCSLRRCTSTGSHRFLEFSNSVSPMTIQDCRISGWKATDGAVLLNGAPVTMFDCRFAKAPNADPPVRALRAAQRLILSENTAEGSRELVAGDNQPHRYSVPAGQLQGALGSADRRFFRSTALVPGKVFDARRDFGAKGDGRGDDTTALQRCIDAARSHGRRAIAYLPSGVYNVSETLKITGSEYFVGGSGFLTKLYWRGSEGGTILEVHEPDNVTLQHIAIGNHDVGPMNNAVDVLQTGSAARTRMTYESVFTYGMYQKEPFRKGLHLRGLGPNEVVVLSGVQGNLRVIDSAAATILARTTFEGSVIVEGTSPRRDGFLGFLTRLSTITRHGLYVRDNHSVVMSDYYIEQADNGFVFEGSPGAAPGRITLQGAKLQFNVPKEKPTEGTAMTLNDYQGQIFFGPGQFYVEPSEVRVVNSGVARSGLFILSSLFYQTTLDVRGNPLKLHLLGNEGVGHVSAEGQAKYLPSSNHEPQVALENLSRAFDDLRRLGKIDLQLSHPAQ